MVKITSFISFGEANGSKIKPRFKTPVQVYIYILIPPSAFKPRTLCGCGYKHGSNSVLEGKTVILPVMDSFLLKLVLTVSFVALLIRPILGFKTPSQVGHMLSSLSNHFGLSKPTSHYVVLIGPLNYKTAHYGAYYPETNDLAVSVLSPIGIERTLLHEFTHYLLFSRDPNAEEHGDAFKVTLLEVTNAYRRFKG